MRDFPAPSPLPNILIWRHTIQPDSPSAATLFTKKQRIFFTTPRLSIDTTIQIKHPAMKRVLWNEANVFVRKAEWFMWMLREAASCRC